MKKRILSVICALAIVAGMIIPWSGDVHAASTTTCKCGTAVTEWITLTATTTLEAGKHYRLEYDIDNVLISLSADKAGTYCVDLNGHTMVGKNRTIIARAGVVINLLDSSFEKTGKIMSTGAGNYGGGIVYLYPDATLNLYGGTITSVDTSVATATDGAVVRVNGAELNMYGGKIVGGTATQYGGAVSLAGGTLNVCGGSIVGGTAPKGRCVYANSSSKVILSKNGKIEELYFEDAATAASVLTINDRYTGTTALNFTTVPASGAQIGTCPNATVGQENITIINPRMNGVPSGDKLVATVLSGASLKPKGGSVSYYASLKAAVAAAQDGGVIKLLGNNNENVTIPGNVTLDLFGWELSGNINATGTLKLKDSATDDMIIDDTMGFGVVTGTITGNVEPAAGYAALTDANGTSYHKHILKLTNVSLRPGEAGVYYKADIQLNAMMQEKLDRFGIAVSAQNQEPSLEDATTKYTAFGKASYGSTTAKSALITEFLDKNNGVDTNNANAQTDVYGRPYFQYTDAAGTHAVYGYAYGTNLKALTEQIVNERSESLKLAQNRALTGMYDAFYDTLKDWDLAYLQTAKTKKQAAADDNVLKVLVIGNSHGLDSVQLLADVFKTEGSQYDDVVIGAMYIGGCQIYQHVKQIKGDLPYSYYRKHTGQNGSWVRRNDTTMLYALEDENWDIVLLQEMNRVSAIPDTDTEGRFAFGNDDIETVYNYVVQNLGYEPYLMWNMIWTNPEIPEDYLNVVLGVESGDDTYVDPEENPDSGSSSLSAADQAALTTWIFGGGSAPLSSHESWSQQYDMYWDNDSLKMYECTVENVEKYVLGKSELGITVDDVMPAATAVQYALERCGIPENGKRIMGGTDKAMYRDYTHMSDYGRLMVAYLWYAKLTGKTKITEVNYTNVPESMRQTTGYGNLVLDQEQIDAVIASVNYALENPLAGSDLVP